MSTTCPSDSSDEATRVRIMPDMTNENFRISLLRKLSYENQWVPAARQPPKTQTVLIFDWDDTLLCTSYLYNPNHAPLPESAKFLLRKIDRTAKHLLQLAVRLGQTFIITNATEGWVESSAAEHLPNLLPVLQKVEVISARSRHEEEYPHDVGMWKVRAFLDVQSKLNSQMVTNLVSLGDSEYEMDAVQIMGKECEEALVKIIKFKDNPAPLELLKQLQTMAHKLEQVVGYPRHAKVILALKGGSGDGQ